MAIKPNFLCAWKSYKFLIYNLFQAYFNLNIDESSDDSDSDSGSEDEKPKMFMKRTTWQKFTSLR